MSEATETVLVKARTTANKAKTITAVSGIIPVAAPAAAATPFPPLNL